ncbi:MULTISPECIES: hypothetical protein [Streptomyces]|uniref:Lipoprotein n=1 Tax=Streptomyces yunnanensis TaxID=156453 RepID=A0ABY7ZZ43_9ACTN|nr:MULTISPECIES: hypothetical protein [Streptomyces]AJC52731.1 putative IS1650 family transposase [Streptomyces sp. 769]WEB37944.1 hypothetical protein MOV08_00495 [Streptomyces yunnanensis]WEB45475.1 hypothetical protein MOV08_43470 [Streptomyces yunnanensis]
MRTRATTAILVALLPVALTACSGTDSGKTPKKPPVLTTPTNHAPSATADPARADLEKAVRAYTAAYFKPDVTAAYSMISTRCKERISQASLAASLDRAHGMAVTLGDEASADRTVKRFHIDKLTDDLASVSYGVGDPRYDQHDQPWTREGEHWRYDSC